jgi:competence protein ComEA
MVRVTMSVAAAALVYTLLGGTTVWGQPPAGTAAPAGMAAPAAAGTKVNINTADEATLQSLKGIGEKKAKAIIDYRQKNGPFKTVDDLGKVKGIGAKRLGKLKEQITVK